MKKAVKITSFIAIGLILFGGCMVFVSLAASGFNIKNLFYVSDAEQKVYDVTEDYTDINLDIDSDTIELGRSADENTHFICYVTATGDYDVSVTDNTLNIKSIDKKASIKDVIIFNFKEEHAKLYLPKDTYDTLVCKLDSGSFINNETFTFSDADFAIESGSLKLAQMTVEDLQGKVSSGSTTLQNLNVKSISLDNGSGSITLTDVTATDKIQAKSSSGSVNATNVTAKSAELKAGSGSVKTSNVTCEEGFQVKSSSGSLKLEKTVSGGSFEGKTGSGSIHIAGCDGADMDLQTGSGSIKGTVKTVKMFNATSNSGSVKVPGDDANGGKCVLHTGSGSIKVAIEGTEEASELVEED